MSQCLSYLAKTVLDDIYSSLLSMKLQSLNENPLKSLLIKNGNYLPFLGSNPS